MNATECVVLYSGGTDSTCVAALCAEEYSKVHLLTFYEQATRHSPIPKENVARLQKKYGEDRFLHQSISTDLLVKKISYENYLRNCLKYGLFILCSPGFSSLSWHLRTIMYCQEHGIKYVFDGMTQELLHFPGHMQKVREVFKELYKEFGITFESKVIDWSVPPDQRFIDRLIVDRHGFAARPDLKVQRTTGSWLYENNIFPHPNIKGSLFDQRSQHDCYPFVVYNMFVFWFSDLLYTWENFEIKVASLFVEKCQTTKRWLHLALGGDSKALKLFEKAD